MELEKLRSLGLVAEEAVPPPPPPSDSVNLFGDLTLRQHGIFPLCVISDGLLIHHRQEQVRFGNLNGPSEPVGPRSLPACLEG
ncbi:hypothetical protein SAY86_005024 [Trapa natans]|uniref:Uncharacterized protein n=1 Tax=Trapa natans TaxID=22666 RepID=A0AAN7L029_TRANT|nr:hypothetical protein SAY86_005024 [Trapa natans]